MLSASPEFSKIGKSTSPPNRSSPFGYSGSPNQSDALMYRGLEAPVGSFGLGSASGGRNPFGGVGGPSAGSMVAGQLYGRTGRLPSPSARNLELRRQRDLATSLKVYARPATTNVRFLGEGQRSGVKGLYGGSKTNTVKIKRGVRIAKSGGGRR